MKNKSCKDQAKNYDIIQVMIDVEFLPGCKVKTPVSSDFTDIDVARFTLKHVQKTYPDAYLYAHFSLLGDEEQDEFYKERLKKAKQTTDYYRQQYLN